MRIKIQSPITFQQVEKLPAVNPIVVRPPYREIGAPGQMISGGILRAVDYNPDLQPPRLYDTIDRMRNDGQVSGLMSALKLPLLNVDWRINPASDDAADVAIADWLYKNLGAMSNSFESVLYQVLLYLDYGCMPFETVWELDSQNLITLRKLAPRLPKTISYWHVDENGGLQYITQLAYKASSIQPVDIPISKLLLFTNNQEGSDYRGKSLLRPAYKHWYFKDRMYIIDAIAKERRAVGVDVGTLKGNDLTDEDESDLQYALMGLHAHEKQFFIEQEERYTYRIEGLQGRPLAILDSIEHHDRLILRSVLAEFIALGSQSGGSFALSRDKSSFFTMSLNAIGKHIADVFNRHLIPRWVDYNWSVNGNYPKLVYSRIDSRDIDALSNAIQKLQTSGFINPTSADEESLRDTLELPTVKREQEATGIPLNGNQLSAITTLFQRVGEGLIDKNTAKGILKAAFPFFTDELLQEIIGASE